MSGTTIICYDIAAVVITSICIASLIIRHKLSGPVNRVYFTTMVLVLITALASLGAEVFDEIFGAAMASETMPHMRSALVARNFLALTYYANRGLTAPVCLVLVAAISDTSHRLSRTRQRRFMLWAPVIATTAIVLTNPLHHFIFAYWSGVMHRGPLIIVLYASSLYYSLVGVAWLIRWRRTLDHDTFVTLLSLYPIVLSSVVIQYFFPTLKLEMFVTSVMLMLLSAFVVRPEHQLDSLVNAASLQSYHEMCDRAFLTEKPLCLVYLEIINIDRLRELVGKDELHNIVRDVSARVEDTLERGDVLYYMRNGLFCIAPRNVDATRTLDIARAAHKRNAAQAMTMPQEEQPTAPEMRSCVVRVPEDVSSAVELSNFVRSFSHLVPTSQVTTYVELAKKDDFKLQMALPDVVHRAIHEHSFEVYYQPIYCLHDGQFHSAEALVRLHDPQFGWVSPSIFIPEAEQSGTIVAIGSILLDKIFAFLGGVAYERLGLRYVEVNLSVDQCVRPHMARELIGLSQDHGVEPMRVNLEITETSSAYSQQAIDRNVRTLASAGFTFSLDDYGTGYSNITRALSLPFSLIKFDKAFVDGIENPSTATVLKKSIRMMHDIGKEVLVEGVETGEQAATLRAMGADFIQGFHFARPMPEAEFVAFLREHNHEAAGSAAPDPSSQS